MRLIIAVLLLPLLIEVGCRIAAHVLRKPHAHEAHHCAVGVLCGVLHGGSRRARHKSRAETGIAQSARALHLLERRHVVFIGGHRSHGKGRNLYAAKLRPFRRENFVERIGDFVRVIHKRRITDAQLAYFAECRLKRIEQLHLKLAVDFGARICFGHISANVRVEQHRINDFI